MNRKLTRDKQMSRTPAQPGDEGQPGQHFILIALLNKFGFTPNSKMQAMKLAEELLNQDWEDNPLPDA